MIRLIHRPKHGIVRKFDERNHILIRFTHHGWTNFKGRFVTNEK